MPSTSKSGPFVPRSRRFIQCVGIGAIRSGAISDTLFFSILAASTPTDSVRGSLARFLHPNNRISQLVLVDTQGDDRPKMIPPISTAWTIVTHIGRSGGGRTSFADGLVDANQRPAARSAEQRLHCWGQQLTTHRNCRLGAAVDPSPTPVRGAATFVQIPLKRPCSTGALSQTSRRVNLFLCVGSNAKDRFDVTTQGVLAQTHGVLFAPSAIDYKTLGQNLCQNSLVHAEFRQSELQLVHVTVIPDLFGARYGFQPGRQIVFDKRRCVGVPPMPAGYDVGKDPRVTGQFLVRDTGQNGHGERHLRKTVEQMFILNQGDAAVVQVLPLEDPSAHRRHD